MYILALAHGASESSNSINFLLDALKLELFVTEKAFINAKVLLCFDMKFINLSLSLQQPGSLLGYPFTHFSQFHKSSDPSFVRTPATIAADGARYLAKSAERPDVRIDPRNFNSTVGIPAKIYMVQAGNYIFAFNFFYSPWAGPGEQEG